MLHNENPGPEMYDSGDQAVGPASPAGGGTMPSEAIDMFNRAETVLAQVQ